MENNLYIPKTITIGFRTRTDTFTGKLGYVIYTDHTGKLRKEASWQNWRDRQITPLTFNNEPTKGFTFNKGVKRDGHWGSGRSVIRVWDPRDFEFEISVDNLIGILMHADVSKRDITEPCVFAWQGTELILLPTNSVEYQESTKYTAKQSQKVSAKDLVPGYSYGLKKEQRAVVYLGRMDRFDEKAITDNPDENSYHRWPTRYVVQHKKPKKFHAFIDPDTKEVEIKDPTTYLASIESTEVHSEFASLLDHYYSSYDSQPVVGVKVDRFTPGRYGYSLDSAWFEVEENLYVRFDANRYNGLKTKVHHFARWHPDICQLEYSYDSSARGSHYGYYPSYPANKLGIEVHDPRVIRLQEIFTNIQHAYSGRHESRPFTEEYEAYIARQDKIQEAMVNELHTFGGGQLAFILGDGKVAIDNRK